MDDLDLLRDGDGDRTPGRRPWGLPVAALVLALLAVSGLVLTASWVTGGGTGLTPAAASPEPTTPAPTTADDETTPAPPITVTTPTSVPTVPPATTVPTPGPTTRRPTLPPPLPTHPQLVRVPDVTGQRLLRAVLVLWAAGFRVSVPGGVVPGPGPDGRRVAAQGPVGGTLAPRGSTVVLGLDSS